LGVEWLKGGEIKEKVEETKGKRASEQLKIETQRT
jgi:hypothetical protein